MSIKILEKHLESNKLAHGYLLVGDFSIDDIKPMFQKVLETNLKTIHPDLFIFLGEKLGIDDVRLIKQKAYSSPLVSDKKVFFINAQKITREAQNALLKVLEDTPQNTHFFIKVAHKEQVLSTVRSRLVQLQVSSMKSSQNEVDEFENAALAIPQESVRYRILEKIQNIRRLMRHPMISSKMYLDYIFTLLEKP